MARNPDAQFSMINISLKNGENYSSSLVAGTVKDLKPAITFICSGSPTTVLVEDIKSIAISIDNWCPRCE